MARTFRDPQEEIDFISEVEAELERLADVGVIDSDPVGSVKAHYGTRRAELAGALSGGGRILSAEVIAKRGTVSWVAWIGVAIVMAATLIYVEQSWWQVARIGRLGILAGLTAAFFVGAYYLYARTGMRNTGLAILTLAEGMLLTTIGYAIDSFGIGLHADFGVADWTALLALGALIFALTGWRLDEPWMYYLAAGLLVAGSKTAVEWGFFRWHESLYVTEFTVGGGYSPGAHWERYRTVRGWTEFGVDVALGSILFSVGWLYARATDWRHANPILFAGTLWLIAAFVIIPDFLLPTNADGLLGLACAIGLLWFGLARQKKAIAIAATVGLAASLLRVESEFFTHPLVRTGSLLALGVAIIALAVAFERRRRDIMDRLGAWQ